MTGPACNAMVRSGVKTDPEWEAMAKLDDILGGSPGAVVLKLAVVSLVVGIVLAALGLEPFDVLDSIRRLVARLYDMGFEAVEKAFGWLLTGALIVVPVWLVLRLFRVGGQNRP